MVKDPKVFEVNGAKLALYSIEGLRAVAISIKLKAGSWYEGEGEKWGLAHLLEHMIFQGTKKFPDRDAIEMYKEENGISCNGATGGSHIELSFRMPGESFEKGMDLIEQMLFELSIPEDALEKQKKIISQEYEDKFSRPNARFWRKNNEQLFGKNHLYVRDGIGTPECFLNVSREQLFEYMKKNFVAEKMSIAVAGNFEEKVVLERVKKMLNRSGVADTLVFKEIEPSQKRLVHLESGMTSATLEMTWFTKGIDEMSIEEKVRLRLASYLFGGSSRSVLFKEIRERLGLAYSASSSMGSYPTVGFFEVQTSVKKEKVDETIKEVEGLVSSFVEKPIEKEVFERARKYLIMLEEMAFESAMGTANSLCNALFWYGKVIPMDEYRKLLEAVTENEVREVLGSIVSVEPMVAIMMSE